MCGLSMTHVQAQNTAGLRDSLAKATDALAYHPDDIDLRLKKVGWNIELNQWEYAKDDLDKVLFMQPTNVAGMFYRAFVNEKMGRYKFARYDYEHLLAIVPDHFESKLGLALVNQKDKHFTEAMDQINSLVEAYPDSAVAYAARAGIEVERKMLELAEYDYTKAFELNGDNLDYLLSRADLRIQLGKKDQARDDLDLLVSKGCGRGELESYYRKLRKK